MNIVFSVAETAAEGTAVFPWQSMLIFVGVIAAVLIVFKIFKSSVKRLVKIAINAAIGCALLYLFSLIPSVGFSLTWWHAVLTGLFGIPAAIIIVVLHFIL